MLCVCAFLAWWYAVARFEASGQNARNEYGQYLYRRGLIGVYVRVAPGVLRLQTPYEWKSGALPNPTMAPTLPRMPHNRIAGGG